MILKIAYGKQIHLYNGNKTLEDLQEHCSRVFSDLPLNYDFYYLDDDQDQITISCPDDLASLYLLEGSKKIKKIFIREQTQFQQPISKDIFHLRPQLKTVNLYEQTFLIKDTVEEFLEEMNEEIIEKWQAQQEALIKEEVSAYMEKITQNSIEMALNDKNVEIQTEKQLSVEEMMENKINKMMPDIIERVIEAIEMRFTCPSCYWRLRRV